MKAVTMAKAPKVIVHLIANSHLQLAPKSRSSLTEDL